MIPLKFNIRTAKFPKLLAELSHSNQFLKAFSAGSLVLSVLMVLLAFVLLHRDPIIVALSPVGGVYLKSELPRADIEVSAAIKTYLDSRYNWTKDSIDQNLENAKAFIATSQVKDFQAGVASVKNFAKEKSVFQRSYPSSINVDMKKGSAIVIGDRITEIQGVKMAGPLNLELLFSSGPRSTANPWGIYITKEIERK